MSQAAATRPAGDPLTIIARIDDRALQAGVEARCNGVSDAVARVRFASLPDLAARQLFLARPLDAFRHAGRGARKVFVFGYSPTVASYVRRVRAGGHFRDGVPPEFVVVDPRAAQLDVELRARLPGADMLSPLHFEEGAYDRPGEADHLYDGLVARHGEPIAVIVDTGDDRLTSAIAETVDARYRREDRACPIIHVRIESDSEAPAGATIHRFGGSDDFADPALLTQEGHDALARSIHDFYLEGRLSEGDRIGSRGSMHEWEALGENFRDDNRLVADCYQLKLRDIGARVIGGGGPPLRLEAEELEELSRAEHGRWMASKLLDGWVHGPQRDDARRVHPDIVPYDALSERIKDLDREQVRVMTRLLSATGKRPLRVITLALAPGGGAGLAAGLPAVLAAVAEHYPDRVPVLSGALADAESRRALAAAGQRARLVVGGHVDAVLASLDEADRAAATALVRDADTLIGVPADGDLNGQVFAGADLLVTTSASIEAPCPVIRLAASGAILAAPWRS